MKKSNGQKWNCLKCTEIINNSIKIANSVKIDKSNENQDFSKTVRELERTVIFLAEKFDNLEKENKEILQLIKIMKKDKDALVKENENLKNNLVKCKKEIDILSRKTNKEEQLKIKNNIEIKGVPKIQTISDENIVNNVFSKIGAKIEKKSIVKIQRKLLEAKKRDNKHQNSIQVTIENQELKNEIMVKSKAYFRNRGKLTNLDIKIPGPVNTIYINEELTSKNKYMLGKARELKKFNYKYIWYKNGQIFVRKTEEDNIILIQNEDEINKLMMYG